MPNRPRTHRSSGRPTTTAPRAGANARGYTYAWQQAAKAYLKQHPVCECADCKAHDRLLVATVVDHVIPHRGNRALFWDSDNWMAMSKACHDAKTARGE